MTLIIILILFELLFVNVSGNIIFDYYKFLVLCVYFPFSLSNLYYVFSAGDSADDDGGEQNARQGRQFGFPFQNLGVAPASTVPLSRACKTTAGVAGYCAKYSHCYPYYFASEDTPSSAYGSKDACTYSDEKTSYQGVCCITSQADEYKSVTFGAYQPPTTPPPLLPYFIC